MLNKIISKKKAISPLIATVLLIAFSVTMGAIIMNFSHDTTYELKEEAADKIERGITCSLDMILEIPTINNEKSICYNRSGSNNLEVIIENQGSATAKGVRIFILDNNDNPVTIDSYSKLGSHNWTKYNVSLTHYYADFTFPPNKVLISPILEYTDTTVDLCTDNRIDIEEVRVCS